MNCRCGLGTGSTLEPVRASFRTNESIRGRGLTTFPITPTLHLEFMSTRAWARSRHGRVIACRSYQVNSLPMEWCLNVTQS
jgi:hypothetical protein